MNMCRTNGSAAECVRHKTPFRNKSGLLTGTQIVHPDTCDVARYIVKSGQAPIYVFDFVTQKWFGNSTMRDTMQIINHYKKVDTTCSRHMREIMPVASANIVWINHVEMDVVCMDGVAALVAYKILAAA